MCRKSNILLSISIITKNEEENLPKCLDSLKRLMNIIPCQLIITDTGSTDNTMEIAKQYTDEVYEFQWCDDFAAARNYGLKKAKGKWFMYMDADEWFEDTKEIEDFFLSGEYKKYKNATYMVRNYMTLKNKKHYHDSAVTRMYHMDKALSFKGKIHEFITVTQPIKAFNTFAHHFSYADDNDQEFLNEKYKRNLSLLEAELEEAPDNVRTVYHLAAQYMKMAKDEEWHELVNEWYDKLRDDPSHIYLPFFVKHKSIIHFDNEPKKSIDILEQYIETRNFEKLWDLDLYCILAELYMNGQEYDKAIKICNDFLDLYKRHENGQVEKDLSFFVAVTERTNENGRAVACEIKARCLMKKEELAEAEQTLADLRMENLSSNRLGAVARLYIKILIVNNHIEEILELYKTIAQEGDPKRVQIIFAMIEQNLTGQYDAIKSLSELFTQEPAFKDDKSNPYILLQQFRYYLNTQDENLREVVKTFINIQEKDKFSSIYSEFLLSMFTGADEGEVLLTYFDIDDMKKYIARAFEMCDYLPTLLLDWITKGPHTSVSVIKAYYAVCMLEGVLLRANHLQNEEIDILFKAYINLGQDYISRLYHPDNLTEENIGILPRAVRFIYFADLAQKSMEAENKALYVKYLKCGIQHYPLMFKFVEYLVDDIVKSEENKNQEQLENQMEFQQQAILIKEKILFIAEQGMRDEAIKLLDTYAQINPKDEAGIMELKNQLKINN